MSTQQASYLKKVKEISQSILIMLNMSQTLVWLDSWVKTCCHMSSQGKVVHSSVTLHTYYHIYYWCNSLYLQTDKTLEIHL